MHRLILWDIDHTLVKTGGVGGEVFKDAFQQVTGHRIDRLADVTGRTEPVIFRETLALHGITDPGGYFPAFVAAQAAGYRNRSGEMRARGRALPGARDALRALAELPILTQTVLTGNPQPSAAVKLQTFALDEWLEFGIGAFGTDDPDRPRLVGIAQRRAAERYGREYTPETTVIIGDTIGDVEAAREGGAQIIAVATGRTGPDELRDAGAPIVLPDLSDTGAVVRAVLGEK